MAHKMEYDESRALFARNGMTLTHAQYEQLDLYAHALAEESERQNVTAVRTVPEIWVRHFLDAAYLQRYLAEGNVLDLGTGGGIPAIPLAILNPGLHVTMLDSELRKIEFCAGVTEKLGLAADTVCGRAEELARRPEYDAKFDFAVSRAMAAGSMLTELTVRFLKTGGSLIAMKGRQFDAASERFAEASAALGCHVERTEEYTLEGEPKRLIVVRKDAETPEMYPRRFAKIKRLPL